MPATSIRPVSAGGARHAKHGNVPHTGPHKSRPTANKLKSEQRFGRRGCESRRAAGLEGRGRGRGPRRGRGRERERESILNFTLSTRTGLEFAPPGKAIFTDVNLLLDFALAVKVYHCRPCLPQSCAVSHVILIRVFSQPLVDCE